MYNISMGKKKSKKKFKNPYDMKKDEFEKFMADVKSGKVK